MQGGEVFGHTRGRTLLFGRFAQRNRDLGGRACLIVGMIAQATLRLRAARPSTATALKSKQAKG
jgi:hypothetical protein